MSHHFIACPRLLILLGGIGLSCASPHSLPELAPAHAGAGSAPNAADSCGGGLVRAVTPARTSGPSAVGQDSAAGSGASTGGQAGCGPSPLSLSGSSFAGGAASSSGSGGRSDATAGTPASQGGARLLGSGGSASTAAGSAPLQGGFGGFSAPLITAGKAEQTPTDPSGGDGNSMAPLGGYGGDTGSVFYAAGSGGTLDGAPGVAGRAGNTAGAVAPGGSGGEGGTWSSSDAANWGFEDWSTTPPRGFTLTPPEQVTMSPDFSWVATGEAAASLSWSTTENRDLVAEAYLPVVPGRTYTAHWWVHDSDAAGRARPWLAFYAADGSETARHYSGTYSRDSAEWREYTDQTVAPSDGSMAVRSGLRLYDVEESGAGTLSVDAFDLTEPVTFQPGDGVLDSAVSVLVTPAPSSIGLYAALSDQGVLYLGLENADPSIDHTLAAWLGAPDPANAVTTPSATELLLPGATQGGLLLVLTYQSALGSCSWSSATAGLPLSTLGTASCFAGQALEGAVDLVSVQGLNKPTELPSSLGFWAGALPSVAVPASDILVRHRAQLLTGRVQSEP